ILIVSGLVMLVHGSINKLEHSSMQNNRKSESNQSSNNKEEKTKALDFTLYDQYGKEHKLSEYKGKTIFLNLWATWCPPCRDEMPYIEELYKEYNKNTDEVIILGVASPNLGQEGDAKHVKDFLKQEGYTFPVLLDEGGSLVYQYGISSFPSTFIIDKDGYITQYVPGGMDKDTMKYLINSAK
ncbi:MAG: redoxin family protein, partial [Paeniclostridium sordellii]|nr:redoxin family protein [Paeniclostridium sordellii]